MYFISIKKNFFNLFLYFFKLFKLSNLYSYASGENNNQTNLINKISNSLSKNFEDVNLRKENIFYSGDLLSFSFHVLDIFSNDYLIGSLSNPTLAERDIINVKRTPIGLVSSSLREFSQPIVNSLVLLNLFGVYSI